MSVIEKDCCFANGNNWFRYRTGAIIVEDNSVLFVGSKSFDYLYTVGGGGDYARSMPRMRGRHLRRN